MKNLINAITNEQKTRLENFILKINDVSDVAGLDTWYYRELLPKGKDTSKMTFEGLKAYLIGRKEKQTYKNIENQVQHIKDVFNSGELIEVKIKVQWKRNRTWGANPTAEAWILYKDNEGRSRSEYAKSGSISGCGYDKGSTAVARALNQLNPVLKLLYNHKENTFKVGAKNDEYFGYGSGYGILPCIEGGVGVSCYHGIFKSVGFEFKTTASGKMFDAYSITQKNKTNE